MDRRSVMQVTAADVQIQGFDLEAAIGRMRKALEQRHNAHTPQSQPSGSGLPAGEESASRAAGVVDEHACRPDAKAHGGPGERGKKGMEVFL